MKTFTEPLKELKEFETLSAGVHDMWFCRVNTS